MGNKIVVNEIFLSINGETSSIGMPTTFIRLAGCNLNCWGGCDTTYALNADAGTEMTIEEVLNKVIKLECSRICLTGGEPLLNKAVALELLHTLAIQGFKEVSVETNGSIDLKPYKESLGDQIRLTMDLKPPSSGMSAYMLLENLALLSESDEVKFVIADRKDFQWSVDIMEQYRPKAKILFSPMYEKLTPKQLVEWVLEKKFWQSRIQLQLHKYIWAPDEKGV